MTVKALALAMHLNEASVRHHLRVLLADKKLRHVGPTKGAGKCHSQTQREYL